MSAPKCAACGGDRLMCNLYSYAKGEQAMPALALAMSEGAGLAKGALRIVARDSKEDEGAVTV